MTAATPVRARLEELERAGLDPGSGELPVVLCWLVRDDVALDELPADDLPAVTAAMELLRADPELAWRSFALSLLADELADE